MLVVSLCKGIARPRGAAGALDRALGGMIAREIKDLGFEGNVGEIFSFATHGKIPAKRVLVVGLGEAKKLSAETVRRASGAVVKTLRGRPSRRVTTVLHGAGIGGLSARDAAQALAEGSLLADYQYLKYRERDAKKHKKTSIKELVIVERDAFKERAAEQGIARARTSVAAANYARDLVNEPASVCVPSHLVDHARRIATESKGRVKIEVFDRAEAKRRGMGAFLSVASGAGADPYFIHLTYRHRSRALERGSGARARRIALVGKGITFDSGGLQIKPDHAMQTMKIDMSGAAAVLGVFSVITNIQPRAEVHGIMAVTENMPGPHAYKPGDIVTALNGKTIEIGHTDAEGRVTLADALSFAVKLKSDAIIDLATLTGACMVGLGEEVAGLMASDARLAAKIKNASSESGERVWELPLVQEYAQLNKSDNAEVKNAAGTRYGGAITAGLFLREFVGETPWAHVDIAGPAYAEREFNSYNPKGATGFGARLLIEYLRNL